MNRKFLTAAAVLLSAAGGFFAGKSLESRRIPPSSPGFIHIRNANTRSNYESIHHIRAAQALSSGAGVRIGILDDGFGIDAYGDLYGEHRDFRLPPAPESMAGEAWHGYWMACAAREIAPEAEIIPMGVIVSGNEGAQTDALIRAVRWAAENGVDVLTYSQAQLSAENQARLLPVLEEAFNAGVLTVFLHFPGGHNILPSDNDPRSPELLSANNALVNVYDYDYSNIRWTGLPAGEHALLIDDEREAFLSVSAKAPVTAGVIALMLSACPDMDRSEAASLLRETSYHYEDGEWNMEYALDAAEAVSRCRDRKSKGTE